MTDDDTTFLSVYFVGSMDSFFDRPQSVQLKVKRIIVKLVKISERLPIEPYTIAELALVVWYFLDRLQRPVRVHETELRTTVTLLLQRAGRLAMPEQIDETFVDSKTHRNFLRAFKDSIDFTLHPQSAFFERVLDESKHPEFGFPIRPTPNGFSRIKKALLNFGFLTPRLGESSNSTDSGPKIPAVESPLPQIPVRRRRRRAKKNEAKHWHVKAKDYLRQTNGEISDSDLARLCGVNPSIVSRDPVCQALRRSYVVKKPFKQNLKKDDPAFFPMTNE